MRRMALVASGLALAGAAACNSKPCGGCGPGQACDTATKTCGPALAYGAICEDDAGAALALPCEDGTSCETAVSPPVCATTCDPAATPTTCPAPQQCWTVTDSSGSPITAADGTLLGYCAGISSAGQICGVVGLSFCDPSLSCVFFVDGANDGVCFAPCAPPSDAACTTPNECLAVFADPTVGICAIPQPADAGCVQAEGLFCPEGQICLDPGDGGACFERCTPGPTDSCPGTQSCLAPTTDDTVGICAEAEQPGGPCNPNAGEFCDSAGLCILEDDGGATCHQVCSEEEPTCPTGQSCLQIEGSPLDACG